MSLSYSSSSSSLSALAVVETINNLLNDSVAGCSKPFAVRMVRNSLGAAKGLQVPFLSELADHMEMHRNGDTVEHTTCLDGIDALTRLRALLKQYNSTGVKCDYCDHQLTTLAEYIVFG